MEEQGVHSVRRKAMHTRLAVVNRLDSIAGGRVAGMVGETAWEV